MLIDEFVIPLLEAQDTLITVWFGILRPMLSCALKHDFTVSFFVVRLG